ncbi:MAG TPA: hypothetical protein VG892_07550 [Terriglobales bacterium]|nr:hypothetical protein [Terriglobales bacterium]
MAITANLTGTGVPPVTASQIIGTVNTGTSGAGTTHADAALLPMQAIHDIETAANNSGVILPPGNGSGASMGPGDSMVIYNGDSNTLLLYPPSGGSLNSGTATTGTVSIATHTSVTAISIDGSNFIVQGPSS